MQRYMNNPIITPKDIPDIIPDIINATSVFNPGAMKFKDKILILEPRELYETVGQVPNVIFPTGLIVDKYDAKGFAKLESCVKLYYGAADTSIGMATSTLQELIEKCY